jgi:lipopolysaccharide biosynthesis glycosyltransferase
MKPLVYYAFDESYLECFKHNLKLLRKYNPEIDVCCITPLDFNLDVESFICPEFDPFYTAKYSIVNWKFFDRYDNFLYLDSDAFVIKPLSDVFDTIASNKSCIHGVRDRLSINEKNKFVSKFFRLFETQKPEGPAFNAGTFGFNKNQKSALEDLLKYIEKFKRFKDTKPSDQPFFNEFLGCDKKLLTPTLSKYVYLYGVLRPDTWSNINQTNLQKSFIVHIAGYFRQTGIADKKIETMIEVLNEFI